MKKPVSRYPGGIWICLMLLGLGLNPGCSGQEKKSLSQTKPAPALSHTPDTTAPESPPARQDYVDPFQDLNLDAQLMMVLRRVFQDSKGNMWFVGDDVFCFDGDTLINFSDHAVFRKHVVRQIAEDQEGSLWFGTSNGICKYEPSTERSPGSGSFSQFTEEDGLIHPDVWSMTIDQTGIIWVGTLEGVSRFDPSAEESGGEAFTPFALPETEPDHTRGVTSARVVHSIMEDSQGNIWFATNGGAYIYDPGTGALSHIAEEAGLCHRVVNDILEDKQGNIWFATHHEGVCRWNRSSEAGESASFTHISSEQALKGKEAWSLYEDRSGNIWFPMENAGVYRYEPASDSCTRFHKQEGLPMNGVHTIVEDQAGKIWLGGFGGLYCLDVSSGTCVNITLEGPWTKP